MRYEVNDERVKMNIPDKDMVGLIYGMFKMPML